MMLKVRIVKLELEKLLNILEIKLKETNDIDLKELNLRLSTVISILDCMLITGPNAIIDKDSFVNILQENEVYNLYDIVSELDNKSEFNSILKLCENY